MECRSSFDGGAREPGRRACRPHRRSAVSGGSTPAPDDIAERSSLSLALSRGGGGPRYSYSPAEAAGADRAAAKQMHIAARLVRRIRGFPRSAAPGRPAPVSGARGRSVQNVPHAPTGFEAPDDDRASGHGRAHVRATLVSPPADRDRCSATRSSCRTGKRPGDCGRSRSWRRPHP